LSLPTESGVRRVRQGTDPVTEQPHLAFPHATHLDPRGVRSPLQGRMKLDCVSCHQPDASKRGFEPISMAKHCQECHQLQFEPAVTTREVPHGKPAEVMQVVDEFYASLALRGTPDSFQKAFGVPGEGLLRRAGAGTAEREDALRLASRKAKLVADELFQKRVCATCHEVSRANDAWRIEPVRIPRRWMPDALFDHAAHGQAKCASCHDVAKSKKSSEVAMPAIARCRECHAGSQPSRGKVTSNCLLCHGFHDPRYPWDPGFRPRAATRVAAQGHDDAR
jgi:predicted CXXCH cytochrome family protein